MYWALPHPSGVHWRIPTVAPGDQNRRTTATREATGDSDRCRGGLFPVVFPAKNQGVRDLFQTTIKYIILSYYGRPGTRPEKPRFAGGKPPRRDLPGRPRARRESRLLRGGRVLLLANLQSPHPDRLRPPGEPVSRLVRGAGAGAAPGHARPGRAVPGRTPRCRPHQEPGPRGATALLRCPSGPARPPEPVSFSPGGPPEPAFSPAIPSGRDGRPRRPSSRRAVSSPPSRRTMCTGYGTGRSWGP